MPKKSARTSRQQTQNTCTPSWEGIPHALQPYILDFLSPIEALSSITTSKDNLKNFGTYVIQRLRYENFSYAMINSSSLSTIAMRKNGELFAWGSNL